MKSVRGSLARIAVFVVAMLSAIGAWEVYKGAVLPAMSQVYVGVPPPATDTHFVCYKVKDRDDDYGFAATVEIKNQFEDRVVKVKDEDRVLCVPTTKVPSVNQANSQATVLDRIAVTVMVRLRGLAVARQPPANRPREPGATSTASCSVRST